MTDPFYRLAPFIQEYIYRNKWESLRDVQVESIAAILDTPDHVLISSATASGKTEAALLPIITDLYNNPPTTIGAMYIGPLKALINDQFERLTDLLEESHIPFQSWHGDIAQAKKVRFIKQAQGILQITPESLEAMLMNRHHEIGRLFSDLRYVIIDEIHVFLDTDRGRQVMCQLERIARYQKTPSRRIGLSATIGKPEIAQEWLKGNTSTPVRLIKSAGGSQVELGLEYFLLPNDENDKFYSQDIDLREDDTLSDENPDKIEVVDNGVFFDHLHQMTQRFAKTLIFANSRANTEDIVINLRQISSEKKLPSYYHVHHGNISAPLRESAEEAMRDSSQKACVAATLTLELGIDIGQLDQVIQVNATHSVSSFVQRLGRSGRRGGPSRMFFYATARDSVESHIGKTISWDFLQTLAIIQLYFEEYWIEPPSICLMPLSLLYHQTMSTIKSHTELLPSQLAERILTLSPFRNITQDHLRRLLHHLLKTEHLEQTDIGSLIIGYKADRFVNNYRFYATFEDEITYQVRDASREIGTIQSAPDIGTTIVLAGFIWRVKNVNKDKRIIDVVRVSGQAKTYWMGDAPEVHTKILLKMREILRSDSQYAYLHDRASVLLSNVRAIAYKNNLANDSILSIAPNRFIIFPWCGTRAFATQLLLLQSVGIKVISSFSPYYYEISYKADTAKQVQLKFAEIIAHPAKPSELVELVNDWDLRRYKYDRYVPLDLLKESYASDFFDVEGAIESLQNL